MKLAMNLQTLALAVTCGFSAFSSISLGYEEPALLWKIPVGKKIDVTSEEIRQVFASTEGSSDQTAQTSLRVEQSWEVKSSSDGVATIESTINRIQFRVELFENAVGKTVCLFDSQTAKKPDDDLFNFGLHSMEQEVFIDLIGKPLQLKMDLKGKIHSISLPKGTALDKVAVDKWKSLLDNQKVRTNFDETGNAVTSAFTMEMLREDLFADTLPLAFFLKRSGPVLPQVLTDSNSWQQPATVNFVDPMLKASFTFHQSTNVPEVKNPNLAVFTLDIQPQANPYSYIDVLGADEYISGTGQLIWDKKKGRISEYKVIETIKSVDDILNEPAKRTVRTTNIKFSEWSK